MDATGDDTPRHDDAPERRAVLTLSLPDRAEAPGAARKALTALNGALHLVSEPRLTDVQLIVSELVGNAVRHGGAPDAPLDLVVYADARVMRVEVSDAGPGFEPDAVPTPRPDGSGGWGLAIVAALAHRWGVANRARTTVWFEIDRPAKESELSAHPVEPR